MTTYRLRPRGLLIALSIVQFLVIDTASAQCTCKKRKVCETVKPLLNRSLSDLHNNTFNKTAHIQETWPNVTSSLTHAEIVMDGICNITLLSEIDGDEELDVIEEKACKWLYNAAPDILSECGAEIRYYCFRKEVHEDAVDTLLELINNDLVCSQC